MTTAKTHLEKLELHEEILDKKTNSRRHYLSATYIQETDAKIERITILKIDLPVAYFTEPVMTFTANCLGPTVFIDMGFGDLAIHQVDGKFYTIDTIKEKTVDMTMAEIEKKLGHKIRIIGDGEKK